MLFCLTTPCGQNADVTCGVKHGGRHVRGSRSSQGRPGVPIWTHLDSRVRTKLGGRERDRALPPAPTPERIGLFCSRRNFLAKAPGFTSDSPGRDLSAQEVTTSNMVFTKIWGGNSRPEPGSFSFPPEQSPLCQELTRALDSRTAGSNKSEACLGCFIYQEA